jgi:hypothetical protein
MRARRDPYLVLISAKTVAFLWVAAAVLPFFLVPLPDGPFAQRNVIAMAITIAIVGIVGWDVRSLARKSRLATSDKIVYVFVPFALFSSALILVVRGYA